MKLPAKREMQTKMITYQISDTDKRCLTLIKNLNCRFDGSSYTGLYVDSLVKDGQTDSDFSLGFLKLRTTLHIKSL